MEQLSPHQEQDPSLVPVERAVDDEVIRRALGAPDKGDAA